MPEVLIAREQFEIVLDTELGEQSINRSNLDSAASAMISKFGGMNVIVAVRHDQRHGRKTLQDLRACFRSRETLQKLLQHQSCRNNSFP